MSDSEFYPLYLTRFAGSLGFAVLVTLLPTYINQLGATGVVIGLFITALGIGRTVAVVPLGWAADRYDKRTILLVSLVMSGIAYGLFALVTSSTGFIVARAFQGLSMVGTGMIALALVGELSPTGERANHIGKFNAWRFGASIVGMLGAGAAYSYVGFDPIFAAIVVLFAAATIGVWLFVESDESSTDFAFFDLAFNDRILTITTFRAQYAVAVTLVRQWVPIYVGVTAAQGGLGLAPLAVGSALAAEKFTNMLCQPYTGNLSDKYGRALFVFIGGGCYGLIALAIPFAGDLGSRLGVTASIPLLGQMPAVFFVVLALNGLLGIADSIREPASMALFADEGEGNGITSSFGVRGLVWRPGAILAPMLGGYLMSALGIEWVFFAGGFAALSGIGVFYGVLAYRHGRQALYRW